MRRRVCWLAVYGASCCLVAADASGVVMFRNHARGGGWLRNDRKPAAASSGVLTHEWAKNACFGWAAIDRLGRAARGASVSQQQEEGRA